MTRDRIAMLCTRFDIVLGPVPMQPPRTDTGCRLSAADLEALCMRFDITLGPVPKPPVRSAFTGVWNAELCTAHGITPSTRHVTIHELLPGVQRRIRRGSGYRCHMRSVR